MNGEIYNLKYYTDIVTGSSKYKLERALLDEARIYGVDDENDICYLQNLFVENKNPILYVFTNEKVIMFLVDNESDCNITVKLCKKSNLKNISYTHAYYDSEYTVEFLMNGEKIVLVPNNDTNTIHSYKFNNNAKNIIEYLKLV